MKTSSTSGTAYISIGAGIIPALFVSIIATAWVTLVGLGLNRTMVEFAVALKGPGMLARTAWETSPYCGIAFLVHLCSIWLFPDMNWKVRAGLYATCGAMIGVSALRVQVTLGGIRFDDGDIVERFHLMVIPGALTALSVYALYGVVLYVAKRTLR
ncbi:MAG: hypothetical protein AAF642_10425, partial [Pseudomonadota bacterium]